MLPGATTPWPISHDAPAMTDLLRPTSLHFCGSLGYPSGLSTIYRIVRSPVRDPLVVAPGYGCSGAGSSSVLERTLLNNPAAVQSTFALPLQDLADYREYSLNNFASAFFRIMLATSP